MVGPLSMNQYKGDMPITIGGEQFTLCYTWDALARVRSELGEEGQTEAFSGNMEKLSVLISIGLAAHHPDFSAQHVFEASPPVIPTIKAVELAMTASFFGPSGMPKELDENPTPPPQTRLNRLWRRLFERE